MSSLVILIIIKDDDKESHNAYESRAFLAFIKSKIIFIFFIVILNPKSYQDHILDDVRPYEMNL